MRGIIKRGRREAFVFILLCFVFIFLNGVKAESAFITEEQAVIGGDEKQVKKRESAKTEKSTEAKEPTKMQEQEEGQGTTGPQEAAGEKQPVPADVQPAEQPVKTDEQPVSISTTDHKPLPISPKEECVSENTLSENTIQKKGFSVPKKYDNRRQTTSDKKLTADIETESRETESPEAEYVQTETTNKADGSRWFLVPALICLSAGTVRIAWRIWIRYGKL